MTGSAMLPLAALVPEGILAATAVLALMAGSFLPRRRQWLVQVLGILGAVASAVAAVPALGAPAATSDGYTVDTVLGFGRVTVALVVVVVLVLGLDTMAGHPRQSEFVVLVVLAGLGAVVLTGASDLLVLTIGYLLASVPVYALIGLTRDPTSPEAALKYYLLSILFGLLMLLGVVVLVAVGGGTAYSTLAAHLPAAPAAGTRVGALALAAGLLFKAGAVPAQFWVPDVFDGAPAAVAAFLSTATKVGALAAIFRLGSTAFAQLPLDWPLLIAIIAAATMTLGNLAALQQTRVRRLLAYSTISQVGYLLMICVAAVRPGIAQPSLLIYLLGYTVTNLAAFAVVAAFPAAVTVADYTGLARRHPWTAFALVVALLGLLGTPPLVVFVGKLTAFGVVLDTGWTWLAILAAANTVLSAFYYLRWLLRLVQPGGTDAPAVAPWSSGAAITLAAAGVLLGILAGPVLTLAAAAP